MLLRESDRSSLRLLGTVGEPINPEAWNWYYTVVGESRCPIVDTWWQTETGGILISPLPGATHLNRVRQLVHCLGYNLHWLMLRVKN
jgi:acetyl-CoA synthetase